MLSVWDVKLIGDKSGEIFEADVTATDPLHALLVAMQNFPGWPIKQASVVRGKLRLLGDGSSLGNVDKLLADGTS